jgi:FixJ family two-component response regulator
MSFLVRRVAWQPAARMMANHQNHRTRANLVVIVDDDRAVRESLRFSLMTEGFSARAYADAGEFLGDSTAQAFDCLVVDQNMPGMSGLQLIVALRSRKVMAPIILITSHPSKVLCERAAALEVPIIEKPLLGSALLDGVRRSLADRQTHCTDHPDN